MAGINFTINTEGEIALSAATAKTVLQLVAASNHRVRVRSFGVFFDGVSPTAEPAVVRLLRQTTAGTMSSATPVKLGTESETLQTTSQKNATSEPTAGDVLRRIEVHTQSGYVEIFPPGAEIMVPGGGRLGIEVTSPAAVNCIAHIDAEE